MTPRRESRQPRRSTLARDQGGTYNLGMSLKELANAALALGPEDRAALMEQLALSLEPEVADLDPAEWRRVWGAELERRLLAIKSGAATLVDEAQVWADAEALLDGLG